MLKVIILLFVIRNVYGANYNVSSLADADSTAIHNSVFRYGSSHVYRHEYGAQGRSIFLTNNILEGSSGFYLSQTQGPRILISGNTMKNATSNFLIANEIFLAQSGLDTVKFICTNNVIEGNGGSFLSLSPGWKTEENFERFVEISDNNIKDVSYAFTIYGYTQWDNANPPSKDDIFIIKDNEVRNVTGQTGYFHNLHYGKFSNNTVKNTYTEYNGYNQGHSTLQFQDIGFNITGNVIDSSYVTGLWADQVYGDIDSNTITNHASGIRLRATLENPTVPNVRYNNITEHEYSAVRFEEYGSAVIHYNDIFITSDANTQFYDVYNNVPSTSVSEIDLRFNYWGEVTTAEMTEGGNPKNIAAIYDEYDDATKGFVNYGNYLEW